MRKLKKILVATDFSLKADRAILRAIDIAKKNGAEITLIHIAKNSRTHDQPHAALQTYLLAYTPSQTVTPID